MQFIAALTLVFIFGAVLYAILCPPAEFEIRASQGAARFRGRFPRSQWAETEHFLQKEFAHCPTLTIRGYRDRGGHMRLTIRGPLSEDERQRIRNFLQFVV
jgi:hypothetical protein